MRIALFSFPSSVLNFGRPSGASFFSKKRCTKREVSLLHKTTYTHYASTMANKEKEPASHPGYPAYYYGDSKGGSVSELDNMSTVKRGGSTSAMRHWGSQPSIGGHSVGSRSLLYGSRRSLYSTYTVSGTSYILPVMTKMPNQFRRPEDNWPIAFCSLFINPIFGIVAILLAEQSKIYFAKCEYVRASQYGVYAKGVACGGIFCTITVLFWIIFIVIWEHIRYTGY